jgi:phosphoenolpyruvate-protein kinase (PTS system EI component)
VRRVAAGEPSRGQGSPTPRAIHTKVVPLGPSIVDLKGRKLSKSLTSGGASPLTRKENQTQMSSKLRDRREQPEQRLRAALLRAEDEVDQALPEKQEQALQHYEKALSRFSRLVVYRRLSEESGAR